MNSFLSMILILAYSILPSNLYVECLKYACANNLPRINDSVCCAFKGLYYIYQIGLMTSVIVCAADFVQWIIKNKVIITLQLPITSEIEVSKYKY